MLREPFLVINADWGLAFVVVWAAFLIKPCAIGVLKGCVKLVAGGHVVDTLMQIAWETRGRDS